MDGCMKSSSIILCSCTLLLAVIGLCSATTDARSANPWPQLQPTTDIAVDLPNVTASGYLPLSDSKTEDMLFYAYYEAQEANGNDTPILLWLEGGPGCASMYGNFYILGPWWVNDTLQLIPNPGTWNRRFGLLFIDQPVGTGYSLAGARGIPTDEMDVAADLYIGLQGFFSRYPELQDRPLFITGESYAGKYVPSIGHFVLQMEAVHGRKERGEAPLRESRTLPQRALNAGPPVFFLAGLAVGNGLTDPRTQVLQHADVAFFSGLIDMDQRITAMTMQLQVSQLIAYGEWAEAHRKREALLGFITDASGVGTLLDPRRFRDYDADKNVERYLNQPAVKAVLGVPKDVQFLECSDKVGAALGPDVLKSVKHLVPDILASLPLLLYQGATDAQDGPASNEPWIFDLAWHGRVEFHAAKRELWRLDVPDQTLESHAEGSLLGEAARREGAGAGFEGRREQGKVVGYQREHSTLRHVVIRNAGHMVPHDQPLVAQAMIEDWVDSALGHRPAALPSQA